MKTLSGPWTIAPDPGNVGRVEGWWRAPRPEAIDAPVPGIIQQVLPGQHGVLGLTRSAAGEVGKLGIRVNAVCPGPIDTRMLQSLEKMNRPDDPDAFRRWNMGRNPMARYGEAEEVARVVVFLCSDGASFVNGAAWIVDGGRAAI